MRQLIIITLALCMTLNAWAQHPSCDGMRYLSPIFPTLNTTLDVQFGSNTTIGGNAIDLKMDIYEPVGDTAVMRPLVILAFGGSFVSGNRQQMADLCEHYAQRGFVAATIDYRLYDGWFIPLPDSVDMITVVIQAVSDMKAAIRYFREDAGTVNNYRIDPNFIVVGGASAGGILASHVAYVDSTDNLDPIELNQINNSGGFQGNSSANTQYSSAVQGVLSFSGALHYVHYMSANEPPLFAAHDDGDNVVPYDFGSATFFGFLPIVSMAGSASMHAQANALGIYSDFVSVPGSGHVSYFQGNSTWRDTVLTASNEFLNTLLCSNSVMVENIPTRSIDAQFYPNPSHGIMTLELAEVPADYTITIYDNLGRVVLQTEAITEHYYTLNHENVAPGIYYAVVRFDDATIAPVQTKVVFR